MAEGAPTAQKQTQIDSIRGSRTVTSSLPSKGNTFAYPLPYYEKVPISIVAAFLHLGEKYAIQQLFDEAKARLCCAFESTLSVAARMSSFHSGTFLLFPGITDGDPHNFQVMNLLQEMDLQAPLPLAMYQCVTSCPLTAVIDGYKFNGFRLFVVSGESTILHPHEKHYRQFSSPTRAKLACVDQLRRPIELCV
ncbi:hypothetical protein J3R83DRAFT_14034 [Lanmaoa asiatica]|nr:hypothetical protein J3R83DRAFT_14034 [Lanmaoa asiatica]